MTDDRRNTDETLAQVRRLLASADPVAPNAYDNAASEFEGRQTLARILRTDPDARGVPGTTRRKSRRWGVAFGAVLMVGGMGVTATAAGLVPESVVNLFESTKDAGPIGDVDTSKATMLAQTQTAGGYTLQWWKAPNKTGGHCDFVRTLDSQDKEVGDSGVACILGEVDTPESGPVWALGGSLAAPEFSGGYFGHADKPAVQVRVTFDNGHTELAKVNAHGYFVGAFDDPDGTLSVSNPKFEALDAHGKVIGVDTWDD